MNFGKVDWLAFAPVIALIVVGWIMIFSVGYNDAAGYQLGVGHFFRTPVGRQTVWIGISALVFMLVFLIDWKFWQTMAYPIYGIGNILLVLVLLVGTTINNAKSWFSFAGITFQPSEIAKFGACLAISSLLSTYSVNLRETRWQAVALLMCVVPMFLILLQPDMGSALVFLSFFVAFYREGLSQNIYLVGFALISLFVTSIIFEAEEVTLVLLFLSGLVLAFSVKKHTWHWVVGLGLIFVTALLLLFQEHISRMEAIIGLSIVFFVFSFVAFFRLDRRVVRMTVGSLIVCASIAFGAEFAYTKVLKPHQKERISMWLRPGDCEPQGNIYQVLQSKMAIGSGGFQGKGFLKGTKTRLNYVPEQSTDFIFCTIGEEQGFVGTFSVIALFMLLLWRIIIIAERQKSNFSRIYAYCVAGILFLHFIVNIGMTMGLMPVIGIPLPFVSRGGSALLGNVAMVAVLLKLDSYHDRI